MIFVSKEPPCYVVMILPMRDFFRTCLCLTSCLGWLKSFGKLQQDDLQEARSSIHLVYLHVR